MMKPNMEKRMIKFLTSCFVLFACLALSAAAFADPKAAKKYAREATKAYAEGNYELALAKFEQAYSEDANPALLYNMGRVYENQANFDAAIENYKRFVTSPDVDQDARVDALDRIKTLNEVIELTRSSPRSKSGKPVLAEGSCVDINRADIDELMKLPRVGEATARKIIDLRTQKGGFKSNLELLDVRGIGDKTYAGMEGDLCPLGDANAVATAAAAARQTAAPKAGAVPVAPKPGAVPVAPKAGAIPVAPHAPKTANSNPAATPPQNDLPVLEI